MAEFQKLNHPPIVEAILDVQAVFPRLIELEKLAALHEKFKQDYPKKEELRIMEFNLQQQAGQPPVASAHDHGVRGYRFFSADTKQIIQCRRDGFTFNRLAPYGSWEDFIAEARSAWEAYRQTFTDGEINRIGVRYINNVIIPFSEGKVDLEEYFTVSLPGPKMEGLTYAGFMEHSLFRDNTSGMDVNWILAQQSTNEPNPGKLAFILDIDVFVLGARAQENEPIQIWETMRELKNRLFFSSFTTKGIELFR